MNKDMIQQELEKLESIEKTVILQHFLKDQQVLLNHQATLNQQQYSDELSEMLLDVIHIAFTSGFETAINSVISSFEEKAMSIKN